jgi:hypothetical protein
MRTTTGTAALAMGAGLLRGPLAAAAPPGGALPKPIPGGLDLLGLITGTPGPLFHVRPPTLYNPDGSTNEPSTITDFNGFIAAADIQGTGTATNTQTGETTRLTFDADIRFMDGVFVGEDGRTRRGTFGFIWLDLFTGQFDQEIHDFEPGITSSGLFWTIPIPSHTVATHLGAGRASFQMDNLAMTDYTDIVNAIGAEDPPIPVANGVVSFDVEWRANDRPVQVRDEANGFAGFFMTSLATIEWSASEPSSNLQFVSDPASTSTTVSGVIGREHNGRFMPGPS